MAETRFVTEGLTDGRTDGRTVRFGGTKLNYILRGRKNKFLGSFILNVHLKFHAPLS